MGSGTAVAIEGLRAALERLGHRVTPIGSGGGPPALWRDAPPGLWRDAPPAGPPPLWARLRYNARLPRRLARARFDLVVGFDLDGFTISGRTFDPYVVALKGVAADELRFENRRERRRLRALARLERWNARRAHRVFVTSRYSRDRAISTYGLIPDRVVVVPEGVDVGFWSSARRVRSAGGTGHDAQPAPPVILSVARQYPRKNTRRLLDAFVHVRPHFPGVRLRIVGGGPEIPRLRERAAELGWLRDGTVTFAGELRSRDTLLEEYSRATLFCLPSLQEGFGIVFVEAMAAGLPVVGPRAGAVPEIVPDGVAGYLVDPRSETEIGRALVRLLASPALRHAMGEAGRSHARAYDWSRVAHRFLRASPAGEAASASECR